MKYVESHSFTAVPQQPLSVFQILKLSAVVYKNSFWILMRTFFVPCVVLFVSDLPTDFYAAEAGGTDLFSLVKAGILSLIGFIGWAFFTLYGVIQTLTLRRMLLHPTEEKNSASSYVGQVVWKSIAARIVTGALQLLIANVFLIAWIVLFLKDVGASPMEAIQSAFQGNPGMLGAVVCVVLASLPWIYIEFWYTCFSTQLAAEDASWDSLLFRAFSLSKDAFWKGCVFTFCLMLGFGLGSYFLSPLTIHNLPILLSFDMESMAGPKPLLLTLSDTAAHFVTNLLILPFVAICTAYFVNDINVRFQNKAESKPI